MFASLPVLLAWSYYHYRRSRAFQESALSLLTQFVSATTAKNGGAGSGVHPLYTEVGWYCALSVVVSSF